MKTQRKVAGKNKKIILSILIFLSAVFAVSLSVSAANVCDNVVVGTIAFSEGSIKLGESVTITVNAVAPAGETVESIRVKTGDFDDSKNYIQNCLLNKCEYTFTKTYNTADTYIVSADIILNTGGKTTIKQTFEVAGKKTIQLLSVLPYQLGTLSLNKYTYTSNESATATVDASIGTAGMAIRSIELYTAGGSKFGSTYDCVTNNGGWYNSCYAKFNFGFNGSGQYDIVAHINISESTMIFSDGHQGGWGPRGYSRTNSVSVNVTDSSTDTDPNITPTTIPPGLSLHTSISPKSVGNCKPNCEGTVGVAVSASAPIGESSVSSVWIDYPLKNANAGCIDGFYVLGDKCHIQNNCVSNSPSCAISKNIQFSISSPANQTETVNIESGARDFKYNQKTASNSINLSNSPVTTTTTTTLPPASYSVTASPEVIDCDPNCGTSTITATVTNGKKDSNGNKIELYVDYLDDNAPKKLIGEKNCNMSGGQCVFEKTIDFSNKSPGSYIYTAKFIHVINKANEYWNGEVSADFMGSANVEVNDPPITTITFSKSPALFGDEIVATVVAEGKKLSEINFTQTKGLEIIAFYEKETRKCNGKSTCEKTWTFRIPSEENNNLYDDSSNPISTMDYGFEAVAKDGFGQTGSAEEILPVVYAEPPIVKVDSHYNNTGIYDIEADAGVDFKIKVDAEVPLPESGDKITKLVVSKQGSPDVIFNCSQDIKCENTFTFNEKEVGTYQYSIAALSKFFPNKIETEFNDPKIYIDVKVTSSLRKKLIKLLKDDWKMTDENKITELADFIDAEPEPDTLYNTLLKMLAKDTGVVEYAGSNPLLLAETYVVVYDAVYANNYLVEPYQTNFQNIILPNLEKGVIGVKIETMPAGVEGVYDYKKDFLGLPYSLDINSAYARSVAIHELIHAWQDGSGTQTYGNTMTGYEMEAHLVDTEYVMRGSGYVSEYMKLMGNNTYQLSDISKTFSYNPQENNISFTLLIHIVLFQRALDNVNAIPSRNDLNKITVMAPPNTIPSETKKWSKIMISKMSDAKSKTYLTSKVPELEELFKNNYAIMRKNRLMNQSGVAGMILKIIASTIDFDTLTYPRDGFHIRLPKN
jgi:hypothetical protein